MQMVILDQSQEGETIPKDVWGAGERKISRGEGVSHLNFVVCSTSLIWRFWQFGRQIQNPLNHDLATWLRSRDLTSFSLE